MFEQVLLPVGRDHQGRCALFAFTGELGVVALATLMMAYADGIPMQLQRVVVPLVLSAPPPPAAATRAPVRTAPTRFVPRAFIAPRLVAPLAAPQHAMIIVDAAPSWQDTPGAGTLEGVSGGVPGGVPGGSLNGLLGSIAIPAPVAAAPPKPAAPPPAPTRIRVGGAVESALLTHQVDPVYPLLAKNSRIEGVVQLSAIIGPDGTMKDLRVLSGNPLLVEAALKAVKQWVYRPTSLNGHPVEVATEIAVKFALM